MANLLTLKKLTGIHFVDKGAAVNPSVLVIKTLKEKTMSLKDRITKAISGALENVLKQDEPGAGKSPKQLLEMALEGLPEDKIAAIMAAIGALEQAPAPTPVPKIEDEPKPIESEKTGEKKDEEMKKFFKDAPEEIKKAFSSLEERVKKSEEKTKELETSNKELSEELAKRVVDAEISKEVEVAKSFSFVPGDITKRAALLVSIRKNQGEEAYKEAVQSFKAAHELIKSRGLGANGSGMPGDGADDDAYAELQKRARQIVEKSQDGNKDPDIIRLEAFQRACRENPDLYKRMEEERRARFQ